MDTKPTIALIGSGVMAEAILGSLLKKHFTTPNNIRASEPRQERRLELEERYHISTFARNEEAVDKADVIILSVKPQRLQVVLKGLSGMIPSGSLVLSIVAGASIGTISSVLKHAAVIRSMPNTPAQIGEGITIWSVSAGVTPAQVEIGREILQAMGQEILVEEESYLDMGTALSGTGPAYVFLFMEALIDAGVHLGFPRYIAEQLVVQTLKGSVEYFKQNKAHPATLRNQVTSPGGTSAAALYYLEKAGFRTAISRAVWAAYERAQQLGKDQNSSVPE
ncbi:MAG: pyrroline-5-carboxylate reductase [Anaerolineaceae bacterium]